MAVTYGFYNSLNHDRVYNAEQMSAIFDGIITDGVFDNIGGIFATVTDPSGLRVIVRSGKAWFNSTWTMSDGDLVLAVPAPDVSLSRIDAVVLEVNSEVSVRENSIKIVKGTPASGPAKPVLTNTATVHQHPLAYLTVDPGVTTIAANKIDIRVGKSDCPFITSVLQSTSIDELFNSWQADFDTWFKQVQTTLGDDAAGQLLNMINENWRKTLSDETKKTFGYSLDTIPDDLFLMLCAMTNVHEVGAMVLNAKTSSGQPTVAKIPIFKKGSSTPTVTITTDENGVGVVTLNDGEYYIENYNGIFESITGVNSIIISKGHAARIDLLVTEKEHGEYDMTSDETISIPARIGLVDVFAVGGGASGEAVCSTTTAGAEGGNGGFTATLLKQNLAGKTLTAKIGAGGASVEGSNYPGTNGKAGGDTTVTVNGIGVILTAKGGEATKSDGKSKGGSGGGGFPEASGETTGGSDGSNGRGGGGQGQGTTTRKFGEANNTLYASGGGGCYSSSPAQDSYGGPGGGKGQAWYHSSNYSDNAVVHSGGNATTPGSGGGGCAVYVKSASYLHNYTAKSGKGANGLVSIRW